MNEINDIDGQFSKLYELFFKSHPTPIYVWKYCENDFILIKYNNTADTLAKGKMKDFLGIKASELYKDRPDIIEDLKRCYRDKINFSKELKYYYKALNEERILNVNYYLILPEIVLVHIENITERKKTEQKIKESEIKYRELYSRSNLYKDLFTHDINNILHNILSSIELFPLRLKNPGISQEYDEILNLIKEQITRGSKLVKNVQKLSEIEDTKKPIISIDLCEILRKSIDFLRSSFYYKNLDVKVKTTQSKVFVKGNDLLPNIFENILFNAVKHNLNENIEILIKVSKVKKEQTDFIELEFIDNGIGVPDVVKKELFSRKHRDNEKEKITSGMGIGLILVKSILNSINGEITVEDKIEGEYTKGSNFIILIPEAK